MPLTNAQLTELLKLISLTKEQEIDCQECLSQVAEYAETELAGKPLSKALEAVKLHLAICTECREEYELLRQVLQSLEN